MACRPEDATLSASSRRNEARIARSFFSLRAVIAESYAEIFFGNSTGLGIPCASANREDIAKIAAAIERDPQTTIEIDVAKQQIRFGGQTINASFRESARDALINGRWDPIGELIEGLPAAKQKAVNLSYLASA